MENKNASISGVLTSNDEYILYDRSGCLKRRLIFFPPKPEAKKDNTDEYKYKHVKDKIPKN